MKLTIKVPTWLNWLMPTPPEELEARAKAFGEASRSKSWGNHLASIELHTTVRYEPKD